MTWLMRKTKKKDRDTNFEGFGMEPSDICESHMGSQDRKSDDILDLFYEIEMYVVSIRFFLQVM